MLPRDQFRRCYDSECVKYVCVRACVRMMCVAEPATQYVVSVRAFNDVDKGPVIYDLVYTASSHGSITHARFIFYARQL